MNKLTKQDFKELLQDPVFLQWLSMTYLPSSWVEPTKMAAKFTSFHDQLRHHKNAQTYVKQSMGLEYLDWGFFQIPLTRLLFAPAEKLHRITQVLGALCFQIQLNRVIEKEFRQQLLHCLPAEILQYITKAGPLLLGQRPELLNDIYQRVDLWDAKSKQLVDFYMVGKLVLFKALEFSVTNHKGDRKFNELAIWWRFYEVKFSTDTNINPLLKSVRAPANEQVVTLIIKLTKHLEPECLILLR